MKRFCIFLVVVLTISFSTALSLPNFWYSGVAYNSLGQIITTSPLATVQIDITDGTNSATQSYVNVPVNAFGVFTVQITGAGAINMVSGTKITAKVNGVTVAGEPLYNLYIVNNMLPAGGSSTDQSIDGWVNNPGQTRIEVGTLANGAPRPAGTEFVVTDVGKVGIGTNFPGASLDVRSNSFILPNEPAILGVAYSANVGGVVGRNDIAGGFGVVGYSFGSATGVNGYSETGIAGSFVINNSSSTADALRAVNNGSGRAGVFYGRIAVEDGTQGTGKVLTSDASGNASWQDQNSQSVGINMRGFGVNLTVPTGTFFQIKNWNTNVSEQGGSNYNPATGEYTITKAGIYQINCTVIWQGSANGGSGKVTALNMTLNSPVDAQFLTAIINNFSSNVLSLSKKLNVGDKVGFAVTQNSGADMTLLGADFGTYFSIEYLHK